MIMDKIIAMNMGTRGGDCRTDGSIVVFTDAACIMK